MMSLLLAALTFVSCTVSFPVIDSNGLAHHSRRAVEQNLPVIDLPYGKYQASKYDASSDVYTFKNIRFAAPPTGDLRWAKPAPPAPNTTLQTGEVGGTCFQAMPPSMLYVSLVGGLAPAPQSDGSWWGGITTWLQETIMPYLGTAVSTYPAFLDFVAGEAKKQDLGKAMGGAASSEDCLFLDLFVPGKALKRGNGTALPSLPVVNYIYGGAFIVGAKDGMYDGTPLVKQSGGEVIVVVANYRIGVFGFLNGDTVEKTGTPNAGFWDQRATLEWIQKYIGLVGGDPKDVSVWGESAGAGSIMHHLASFGGKQPSLFQKAVIQSPANRPQYDRKGAVEEQYKTLEDLAGCKGQGLACLRKKDVQIIRDAAEKIMAAAPPGEYGFGPAVDGTFSRQLPDLEFASGNYAKDIQSLIITHTSDEGSAFVEERLRNNKTFFEAGLKYIWGDDAKLQSAILKQYPTPGTPDSPFKDEKDRMVRYMTTQFFACHVRFIAAAYKDKTYIGQYSRGDGKHGRDIQGTFYNNTKLPPTNDKMFPAFAATFENYLLSHARTGDPNKAPRSTLEWKKMSWGPVLGNVMDMGNQGFNIIDDEVTQEKNCGLWLDIYAGVTKKGGYTPAGGEVNTTFA